MNQFFPMGKWEARLLVFLVAMAVIAFLPIWRSVEIGGMVVFGWLLAALMILSPALALLVFRHADGVGVEDVPPDESEQDRTEGESNSSIPQGDQEV